MSAIRSPPTTQSPSPLHKRRRDLSPNPSRHRSPKTQTPRLSHPAFPPPRFWDELSEIPLTKNALRELERRTSQHDSRHSPNNPDDPDDHEAAECCISQCSPNSLDEIKRFALHGGPDLRDLRGHYPRSHQDEEMSASQLSSRGRKRGSQASSSRGRRPNSQLSSSRRSGSTTTKNTGPYDRAFAQHLVDNNILPANYLYPDGSWPPRPDNLDDIRQVLSRRREHLASSQSFKADFKRFVQLDSNAANERQVTSRIIPMICGETDDIKCVAGEAPFTNLRALTNGTLVAGNPDLYYGARPEQLELKVRQQLSHFIAPSTQNDLPILPNFCLAVKGIDGSMGVAMRQACYDGTLGARAMQRLQSYGLPEQVYDNKAYALTAIYHAGMLRLYTIHPIKTPQAKPGFAMTQVRAIAMTDGPDAFHDGISAFRNGCDWAKEQRDNTIRQANERAALVTDTMLDNMTADEDHVSPLSFDSNTSADELSMDVRPSAKRSKPNEA